jgi:hypothetical protein
MTRCGSHRNGHGASSPPVKAPALHYSDMSIPPSIPIVCPVR